MNFSFDDLYTIIIAACHVEHVFGLDIHTQDELRERNKSYLLVLHPDKYEANDKRKFCMAKDACSRLGEHFLKAKEKISATTYGILDEIHSPSSMPLKVFNVGDKEYKVFREITISDISTTFFGTYSHGGITDEEVFIKVPNTKDDNGLIENECKTLRLIVHKHVPILIDEFLLDDGRRVMVTRFISQSFDFLEIKKRYPDGVPDEHIVWILKRLLSAVGFLHINNVIHGNIEPGNLLVTPFNHNCTILDYTFSIINASKNGAKYKVRNDWSAPELSSKPIPKPMPTSDIYSIGKSIKFLATNINECYPSTFKKEVSEFIENKLLKVEPSLRSKDAWLLHDVLGQLRNNVYGSGIRFLPFAM